MTLFHMLRLRPAVYLIAMLALGCAFFSGCKKTGSSKGAATIEPTPEPFEDRVLYTYSGQLYGINLAGDTVEKFPEAGRNIWFPAVSPDNKFIAYWSSLSGYNELWIYDIEQKTNQQITFFNERITRADVQNFNVHNAPAWFPNSKQLVFSHLGKIWKIDASGFNLETLIPMGTHYSPVISPDGKLLAYITELNQHRNITIRQFSTGDEWSITRFPATHRVGSPAWSPDGTRIAFTVSIFEKVDIWTVKFDGSELTRLTKDGYSNSPAWSPGGDKIAFSSGRQDPYQWNIWVMNADGSSQFSVTSKGGFSPAWLRQLRDQSLSRVISIPTPVPTSIPTPAETVKKPAVQPTAKPVKIAKAKPTIMPTAKPKKTPTSEPTMEQVVEAPMPTEAPTLAPTATAKPSTAPVAKAREEKNTEAQVENKVVEDSYEDYEKYEEYADEDEAVLPQDSLSSKQDENKIVFTPKLEFYFAKDLIKPSSLNTLKELAEKLNEYPDATLIVQGFMRGPGLFKKTLPILKSLSRARANSVLRHLIVNEKIRQINVTAIGEGDPFPEIDDSEQKLILLIEVR